MLVRASSVVTIFGEDMGNVRLENVNYVRVCWVGRLFVIGTRS